MSYDTRKKLPGQELVYKVVLRLHACQYAIAATPHSGYDDGSCFGFSATCSTADAYSASAIIPISIVSAPVPTNASEIFLPGLFDVRYQGPQTDTGNTMGQRAQLTFKVEDQDNNDFGIVPYIDRRSSSGTLLGKMLARHPNMEGVVVDFYRGLRDAGTFDEPEWQQHEFFIDDVNLSDDVGYFRCMDALTFADNKKSQVPLSSSGQLVADIAAGAASLTIQNADDYEYGALDDVIYARIDSEVKELQVTGTLSFDVLTEGVRSEIKEHKENATLQLCYHKTNIHIVDVIVDLIQNYTKMPASYIGDYSALIAATPQLVLSEVLFVKPEAVKKRVDKLIKIGRLGFYCDTEAKEIVMYRTAEVDPEIIDISKSVNIVRDSIKTKRREKDQLTQFTHRWGLENITKASDENYAINYTGINTKLLSDKGKNGISVGDEFEDEILTTSSGDVLIGVAYAAGVIDQYRAVPWDMEFKCDASIIGSAAGELQLGKLVSLEVRARQEKDGSIAPSLFEIQAIQGDPVDGYTVKTRLYQSVVIESGDVDFFINTSKENYDLSTEYAPVSAGTYVVYIDYGVVFGATSTANKVFTTGTQASGVKFKIINRGRWLGAGGDAGDGGFSNTNGVPVAGTDGSDGGDVFEMTVDVDIDNSAGQIFAGGGGGAGRETWYYIAGSYTYVSPGSGGGGGQGFKPTAGGDRGSGIDEQGQGQYGNYGSPGGIGGPGLIAARGGYWGEPGENAPIEYSGPIVSTGGYGQYGGAAGRAIITNGNTLNILSGSSSLHIKGTIV